MIEVLPLALVGVGAVVFFFIHRRTERRWAIEREQEAAARER